MDAGLKEWQAARWATYITSTGWQLNRSSRRIVLRYDSPSPLQREPLIPDFSMTVFAKLSRLLNLRLDALDAKPIAGVG
jgi:hypothetical protein